MAIRDRITIKTKDGDVVGLVVKKQGGQIAVRYPDRGETMIRAEVLDKMGQPTGEEIRIRDDQVVYVSRDQEPMPKKAK